MFNQRQVENPKPALTTARSISAAVLVLLLGVVMPLPTPAQTSESEGSAPSNNLKVLYDFPNSQDGIGPAADLLRDASGNLYGTTLTGGSNDWGTVFRLSPNGKETVLHSFTGVPDGAVPQSNLVRDTAGNFYGTTYAGGSSACGGVPPGCGTVFKLAPDGTETVLHVFPDQANDGVFPMWGGLIQDAAGNLYGNTTAGGANSGGTVFEITASGDYSILYNFAWLDGQAPQGLLAIDERGNLYGTTASGGANQGAGVVFKLSKNRTTGVWSETILHNFAFSSTDGYDPVGDVVYKNGYVFGITTGGGANSYGIVYKVSTGKNPTETVLYNFTGGPDGANPNGGVVLDAYNNIYGVTDTGAKGQGAVYRLTPSGKLDVLHVFAADGSEGTNSDGNLLMDAKGNIYGTSVGGPYNGLVWSLTRSR